jgi:hypothetical protein
VGIGAALRLGENFMFGFNIFLSVSAIVIGGVILVAGARSEAALHVKLDYLIEHSPARTRSSGSSTRMRGRSRTSVAASKRKPPSCSATR